MNFRGAIAGSAMCVWVRPLEKFINPSVSLRFVVVFSSLHCRFECFRVSVFCL